MVVKSLKYLNMFSYIMLLDLLIYLTLDIIVFMYSFHKYCNPLIYCAILLHSDTWHLIYDHPTCDVWYCIQLHLVFGLYYTSLVICHLTIYILSFYPVIYSEPVSHVLMYFVLMSPACYSH